MALSPTEEKNKEAVLTFYQYALNDKNFDAASASIGNQYIQHNPLAQDGIEGLRQFILYLQNNYPDAHSEIKKVFSDGDYVMLHVHSIRTPGTRGRAIFDLFRLENGKIVEHWDVIQEIPGESSNPNGMF